jgi:hypothetical protein
MRPQAWLVAFSVVVLTTCSTAYAFGADIVPAGTILNVRTTQPVSAESSYVGMQLNAIVDDPVDVGGQIVIPRGAAATLEVVGVERSSNLKGRDRISFRVTALRFDGQTYRVATNDVEFKGRSEGKRTAQKVIGGAGIGAVVGGLLGGGTGAALGATAGGTTGAVVAGSGKSYLVVPAETRLQFRLNNSMSTGR